jgi:hypothetical protein
MGVCAGGSLTALALSPAAAFSALAAEAGLVSWLGLLWALFVERALAAVALEDTVAMVNLDGLKG